MCRFNEKNYTDLNNIVSKHGVHSFVFVLFSSLNRVRTIERKPPPTVG